MVVFLALRKAGPVESGSARLPAARNKIDFGMRILLRWEHYENLKVSKHRVCTGDHRIFGLASSRSRGAGPSLQSRPTTFTQSNP